MDCFMCYTENKSLQKLQTDMDIDILEKIAFVLPDLVIPDTKDPVYACATCLEEMATFYEIKMMSLRNNRRLNLYKDILRGASNAKFNELKIINYGYEFPIKLEQNTEFQINLDLKDPLALEDDQFTEKDSNLPACEESKQSSSKEKRFKCNFCFKTFLRPSKLEKHTRVHTGERPFKCPTCQKSFTQNCILTQHKLIHTGEKPYECDVCHKSFIKKTNLKSHKRSHTKVRPYQCTVCSMAFTQSSSLSRHKITHSGEKPYHCHVCVYKCARAGALQRHIRVHTGEKPYACKLCPKAFTQPKSLKDHKRRLHNIGDELVSN